MSQECAAKVTVRGWKRHTCPRCGCVYRFRFEQVANASAPSPEAAEAIARESGIAEASVAFDKVPCPCCGRVPARVVAHALWESLTVLFVFAVALGVLWVILGATRVMGPETAAIVSASSGLFWFLCAMAEFHTGHSDDDILTNILRARALVDAGLMEILSAGNVDNLPRPPPRTPPGFRRLFWFAVLIGLAPLAPLAARVACGWHWNAGAHPRVVGPGDTVRVRLPDEIEAVRGLWSGEPAARVEGQEQLGFPVALTATANRDTWFGQLSVKSGEKRERPKLWADVTIPEDARLEWQTLRVKIEMVVTYPKLVGELSYEDATAQVTGEAELHLSATRAGDLYMQVWWAGMVVGPLGYLFCGLALLRPVRGLEAVRGERPVIEPDWGGVPWDPYAPNWGQPPPGQEPPPEEPPPKRKPWEWGG